MWVLDTDHVSLLQHENNLVARRLFDRLANVPPAQVVTSVITFEEQVRGRLAAISTAKSPQDVVVAYRRRLQTLSNYRNSIVVDFDELAAGEFERLRAKRVRIGTMVLRIAAIALSRDATLLSRNLSDFSKVPGLRVEDWTV